MKRNGLMDGWIVERTYLEQLAVARVDPLTLIHQSTTRLPYSF